MDWLPRDRRGWLRAGLSWAGFALLAVLAVSFMIRMPGRSHSGPLPPLSDGEAEIRRRVERHVNSLAGEIGERSASRTGSLEAAARYLEQELRALGHSLERQEVQGPGVANLEVVLPGQTDESVVVGAHYDSVIGCPGANDNASGTAAVLELARLLAGRRFARTLRLVFFVNEEPPHYLTDDMGSRRYAGRAKSRGDKITAMLSLETIGYYTDAERSQQYPFPFDRFYPSRGNFVGFVGNLGSRELLRRCVAAFRRTTAFPSEGLAAPGFITGIGWSDHSSFWEQGYQGVMVTDTAFFRYAAYHTPSDTPDKLSFDRMARVVAGLARVVEELAAQ